MSLALDLLERRVGAAKRLDLAFRAFEALAVTVGAANFDRLLVKGGSGGLSTRGAAKWGGKWQCGRRQKRFASNNSQRRLMK